MHPILTPVRLISLLLIWLCAQSVNAAEWLSSARSGNEALFLFAGKVARYDLSTRKWLPSYSLGGTGATAMAEDGDGALVAFKTKIYRYQPGFSERVLLATVSTPVTSLHLDGSRVVVFQSETAPGRVAVLDRSSGATLSEISTGTERIQSVIPTGKPRTFVGLNVYGSPSALRTVTYTAEGQLSAPVKGPILGSEVQATRLWMYPGHDNFVSKGGYAYSLPLGEDDGFLGGGVTDLVPLGDHALVLRGGVLLEFGPRLSEIRRIGLEANTGTTLHVLESDAFVFSPNPQSSGNPLVSIIPLASLKPLPPGPAQRPDTLEYSPVNCWQAKNGDVVLNSGRSIFRWSPEKERYTGNFPLWGYGGYAQFSVENDTVYLTGSSSNTVSRLDLSTDSPVEEAVVHFSQDRFATWAVGDFVSIDGKLYNHQLEQIRLRGPAPAFGTWDSPNRRSYFFRDRLCFQVIGRDGEVVSETQSSSQEARSSVVRPGPGDSGFVLAGKTIYTAPDLVKIATLTLTGEVVDAAWIGSSKLVTMTREYNSTLPTTLKLWRGTSFASASITRSLQGLPVAVFPSREGVICITLIGGKPRFHLLDASFEPVSIPPVTPAVMQWGAVDALSRTESAMTIRWGASTSGNENLRVEYRRLPDGAWISGPSVPTLSGQVTVTGLEPGQEYEFRVFTFVEDLQSEASRTFSSSTLRSSVDPGGEPYYLRHESHTTDTITLSWSDSSSRETGFRIYRSKSEGSLGTAITVPAGTTSYRDTGLAANTVYFYRVQAINGDVAGSLSSQAFAITEKKTAPPPPPYVVTVHAVGPNSNEIYWVPANFVEADFIVQRRKKTNEWVSIGFVSNVVTAQTFYDEDPEPGGLSSYRIVASNKAGTSVMENGVSNTPGFGVPYMEAAGICYFLRSPERLERYELSSRTWLDSVVLSNARPRIWVDESGIFLVEDGALVRRSLDGSSPVVLIPSSRGVVGAFAVSGNVLLTGTNSGLLAVNKFTGAVISTSTGDTKYFSSLQPYADTGKFRAIGSHSASYKVEIDSALGTLSCRYAGETFLGKLHSHRLKDRVVLNNTVIPLDGSAYSLKTGVSWFSSLAFDHWNQPVFLIPNHGLGSRFRMLEFEQSLLGVAVDGQTAFVFWEDGSSPYGLNTQAVPLAELGLASREPQIGGVDSVAIDEPKLNNTNGLFEQHLTIINSSSSGIPGVTLRLDGLPDGVFLYNGTYHESQSGFIYLDYELAAGETIDIVIQYLNEGKIAFSPIPSVIPAAAAEVDTDSSLRITNFERLSNGEMALDFRSEPGRKYQVQYCDEMGDWEACPSLLEAAGTSSRWMDLGPPVTLSSPTMASKRFYRLRRVDE